MHLLESQRVMVFLQGMFASNDGETEKSMMFFNPKRKGNIERTGTRRIPAFVAGNQGSPDDFHSGA
jgi:hypothetical protein